MKFLCFLALLTFGANAFSTLPVPTENAAVYNFGPASNRDTVLFTAERPGHTEDKSATISDDSVREWIAFMRSQSIDHVLSLLDDNELAAYEPSGLVELYRRGGLQCTVQPMRDPMACENILSLLSAAEASGQRVVSHCTGGIGRCGRVAAGWLVHRYGLTPEEATAEVLATAEQVNMVRAGDAKLLAEWLQWKP